MQNKKTRKIIIDQYKLDILFRLGCPDSVIIGLLKTGKFTKTGDRLLDETLESLLTIKEFSNWVAIIIRLEKINILVNLVVNLVVNLTCKMVVNLVVKM